MVLFRETQRFRQLWIWVPLLAGAAWVTWAAWQQLFQGEPVGTHPVGDVGLLLVWLLTAVALPGFFLLIRLRTEIRPDGVHVLFTPFHLRERSFPLESLARVEAVTYSPILEYGGWGLRLGPKGWAYNVSGRKGIRMTFTDGRNLLVGTRKPEAFMDALEEAMAMNQDRPRR